MNVLVMGPPLGGAVYRPSMAVCGNRMKARRHYDRLRESRPVAVGPAGSSPQRAQGEDVAEIPHAVLR
jgi:hypothetical protein